MSTVLGLNCKLYRGTAGTRAITEMSNITDLRLEMEHDEADITTRASGGWKMTLPALRDAEIRFEMLYDSSDPDFTAVRSAFFARGALAFFVTDGSGCGLDCDCIVTGFSIVQDLTDAVKVSVTLKPSASAGRVPAWV